MNLDQKRQLTKRLEGILSEDKTLALVSFQGLSVQHAVELRRSLFQAQASMLVVKNSILKRVFSEAPAEVLLKNVRGGAAVVWGSDPVALAKAIEGFQKKVRETVECPSVLMADGSGEVSLERLATLPSMEVLRGKLLGMLQQVGTNFVRVLAEPSAGMVRCLSARASK